MDISRYQVDIYEQQKANRRKTILVMALFALFLAFLGFGVDVFFFDVDPQSLFIGGFFPIATVTALLIGAGTSFWGLKNGDRAVLASSGASPVTDEPRFQQLRNVADEMAIASGLPRPKLYVIPDEDLNAFATGKDPEHASIAVTQGLVDRLTRDELQGVIAHEMSHIRNYDIRLMTVVAALAGAILLLSTWARYGMLFGGRGRNRRSSQRGGGGGVVALLFLVLWILGVILAPVIARVLAMAVSRQREFYADASGAELTRNPGSLAAALEKIESAADPTRSIKKGTAHMCIVDPLGQRTNLREGKVADLFATHPPIERRIRLLKAMAYEYPELAGR